MYTTGTSTVPDRCKKLCNIAHHRLVPRRRENAPMLSEISGENTAIENADSSEIWRWKSEFTSRPTFVHKPTSSCVMTYYAACDSACDACHDFDSASSCPCSASCAVPVTTSCPFCACDLWIVTDYVCVFCVNCLSYLYSEKKLHVFFISTFEEKPNISNRELSSTTLSQKRKTCYLVIFQNGGVVIKLLACRPQVLFLVLLLRF